MGHEWKIGDWAEIHGIRYLVWGASGAKAFGIPKTGFAMTWDAGDKSVKHLPECTGWDWNPEDSKKQIKPPPGYRIVTEGQILNGDMSLQDRGWYYSTAKGKDIAELLVLGAAKAYARKIDPPKAVPPAGYRLLERDEVVADGDLLIKRAPAGNDYDWRTASVDHFGTTVGYLVDTYHIACFARKIETEPVAHEWKFGDWAMTKQNNIVRFVSVDDDGDHMFVDYDGNVSSFNELMLVHLPDCKNWHWTPEDPKKQIEPRYRPFANAAEFAPYRDKWVMNWSGNNPSYRKRIVEFDDDGVWDVDEGISWKDMARRYRFEDGTPFGVLETEKQQ